MAIIKFISDKTCQLFIDTEKVGEVLANKMLKLTLDIGSYLVEVKNDDGKCLKRYELKVDSANSQVLQDLTISSDTISETIEKLRNDSSFFFIAIIEDMAKRREIRNSRAEFLIFQAEAKEQGVEVYYKDENIWAKQKAMATSFYIISPFPQAIEQGTETL